MNAQILHNAAPAVVLAAAGMMYLVRVFSVGGRSRALGERALPLSVCQACCMLKPLLL